MKGGSGACAAGAVATTRAKRHWIPSGTGVTVLASTSKSAEPEHKASGVPTLSPETVIAYPEPAGMPSIRAETVVLLVTSIEPALAKFSPVMA